MYRKILEYYRQCFAMVDMFHCNSECAWKVYRCFLPEMHGIVVPITHNGIKDRRKLHSFDNDILHVGFIGSDAPYKGLPMLIEILRVLDITKWELSVWGGKFGKHRELPIFYKGKFDNKILPDVYHSMDLLVVPSIWYETFSLVTIEALSFGVPTLVSDRVGAKDVVREYDNRFVFSTKEDLLRILFRLIEDKTMLSDYNQKIVNTPWMHEMKLHAKDVVDIFYK